MDDIGIVVSDYASNVQSNSPATNTGDDVVSAPLSDPSLSGKRTSTVWKREKTVC